jgi:prevent-host-death family protein
MKEVAVYEAKTRLSELLAAVEQGERFVITRRGRPVAALIAAGASPRSPASRRNQVAAVFARLKRQRKGVRLEGDVRAIAAEGRD